MFVYEMGFYLEGGEPRCRIPYGEHERAGDALIEMLRDVDCYCEDVGLNPLPGDWDRVVFQVNIIQDKRRLKDSLDVNFVYCKSKRALFVSTRMGECVGQAVTKWVVRHYLDMELGRKVGVFDPWPAIVGRRFRDHFEGGSMRGFRDMRREAWEGSWDLGRQPWDSWDSWDSRGGERSESELPADAASVGRGQKLSELNDPYPRGRKGRRFKVFDNVYDFNGDRMKLTARTQVEYMDHLLKQFMANSEPMMPIKPLYSNPKSIFKNEQAEWFSRHVRPYRDGRNRCNGTVIFSLDKLPPEPSRG